VNDGKERDMPTLTPQAQRSKRPRRQYLSDADRWRAVAARDRAADGRFVYAVRTTGVYCRPSCGARLARRENVCFHATPADAERAGFRACKRCGPASPAASAGGAHAHAAAVAAACGRIAGAAGGAPPDVATLAAAAGMSPSHFHRVFKSLTGVTPKAYAAARRAARLRESLSRRGGGGGTVTAALYDAGFNSPGRFYAASPKVLGMTPAAFRAGGAGATIRFAVGACSLGAILVAASEVGVCSIALGDDPDALVRDLRDRFPRAELVGRDPAFARLVARVVAVVERPAATGPSLPLDVRGTAFQLRVWQKLCEIPPGSTRTYAQLAASLGEPRAARAVAGACAANPLAVAIPCHRVVRTGGGGGGALAGYRWGVARKARLLAAERAAAAVVPPVPPAV
jgi:AraC family transcriptional regulator of adaptative response/methylated-DNA-[protein]-cysteine methyltransferase